MKRLVIDTNIAFSSFLNINSRIGQILLNSSKHYDIYAPEYIKDELFEHKERIKKNGKLSEDRFVELYGLIMRNIRTLNHAIIPRDFYLKAHELCKDIDIDDTPFIAINDFVRGQLWTGDVKLTNGLINKGYTRIISTNDLYLDFIKKVNK